MAKSSSLQSRRRGLEGRIASERRAVQQAADQWLTATASFDRKVEKLSALKVPAALVGGLITLRLVRKPGKLITLARKGIGLYTLTRGVRKMISQAR
ncbi:YqjK family protein [Carnimonas nigrificans]|uniref:YqjK family protein n=1 Tax=Carnimonas nigrificans TaxID=64323 RepID=UPI000470745C|nr:YqjK family protein [Carnimonas nigrificans]